MGAEEEVQEVGGKELSFVHVLMPTMNAFNMYFKYVLVTKRVACVTGRLFFSPIKN